jgi:hypothetical protein
MIKIVILISGAILLAFSSGCATSNNGSMGQFVRLKNSKWHGFNVVKDPTGTAPTQNIDRFEVRAGDCSANAVSNDCKTARERSELAGPYEARLGREEWYGWYIYIPQDWKDITPAWNIYGQFYQDGGNALFATRITNQGLLVHHFLKDKQSPHFDIDLMRGKWTKVEMHIKWEKEVDGVMPDGFVNVYVNGTTLYSYKGNTVSSYGDSSKIQFKYGIYRFRLDQLSGKPAPTQIVYYADLSRANSRDGLFSSK